MKRFLVMCIVIWIVVFVTPLILLRKNSGDELPALPIPTAEGENSAASIDNTVTVSLSRSGSVESIPLNEYLEGVVSAEMPALFPEEALRAQAVAARTYTMKKLSSPPATGHNGAAVCDNPAHCKAYKPLASMAASWNNNAGEYSAKIKRAVRDTDGEILLYDGKPISAVFHSTSSGKTENAVDVWGSDVPYLVSVESKGEEDAPKYRDEITLTPDEFRQKFTAKYASAKFDENPENWVTNISRSGAGGVKTLTIGGVSVKGNDVRAVFGLNSANFTIAYDEGKMRITTRGYGHGVGMSQYGARAMAIEGKSYGEILQNYYKGVKLGKISKKTSS